MATIARRRAAGRVNDMKLNLSILMFLAAFGGHAAAPRSEFAAGRAFYAEGEYKKAASYFQLAIHANLEDAESYYWLGMSYQVLADISTPFDRKYRSQARAYLTKATDLAPERRDYRMELFHFLLDSGGSSHDSRRQAEGILRTIPDADPDYSYMRRELDREKKTSASAESRLAELFLAGPRAAYCVAEAPVSALRERSGPALAARTWQ